MQRASGKTVATDAASGATGANEGRVAVVPSPVIPKPIVLDPYRSIIFPNRIRELRARHGYPKLLNLASALPDVPYIRLSKIERGEVMARADEIERIASVLGVAPRDLLIDVDDPDFDISTWSEPFAEGKAKDKAEDEFAVLLGAAMRARRASSAGLTIAAIERDYGIPPVILSRIENAAKPLGRWNDTTVARICRFFDVVDERELRRAVNEQYRHGLLDHYVGVITDPAVRLQKTRVRVSQLLKDLKAANSSVAKPGGRSKPARTPSKPPADHQGEIGMPVAAADGKLQQVRLVPVLGAPLPGGLIAPVETNLTVEACRAAGPRAFGLRVCRPTLGAGLPGNAIVIVDPEAFPSSGGLAAVREDGNFRLLAITFDLNGAMMGYSVTPKLEFSLDSVAPSDIMAVIGASFI